MTPEALQAELALTGIACEVRSGEVFVETCWFCGNTRWNLQLDPEHGRFMCWACNTGKGERLDRVLQERLGQNIHLPTSRRGRRTAPPSTQQAITFKHQQVGDVPLAASFLTRRGVPSTTAKQYNLVVCTEPGHTLVHRLVIPVADFWTGKVVGHLGRTYLNQHPKYLSTLTTRIPAGYRVASWSVACVLVEGFFDGIAVHQAGYSAAVLSGITAPWVQDFGMRLPPQTPLVIMLDGEAEVEAQRLYWALHPLRPSNTIHFAHLPKGADPSDFTPSVLACLLVKILGKEARR